MIETSAATMVPLFSPSVFGRFKDSHSRFTSSASSQKSPPSPMSPSQPPSEPMAILLIGPKQQRFKVNKRQLCAISPFFAERFGDPSSPKSISLWLPRESSSMFSLFVDWVHLGLRFRPHLDELMASAYDAGLEASQNIHWSLIRLHLFASRLGLYRLQDLAMDAIQDLYLRCDWDVPSGLITFLYTECEDLAAIRLRRWAVAMVAFSFTGGPRLTFHPQESAVSEPTRFSDLLEELPEFAADYDIHMEKMRLSGLDIRFKNPQLRIPANRLRNDELSASVDVHMSLVQQDIAVSIRTNPEVSRRRAKAALLWTIRLGYWGGRRRRNFTSDKARKINLKYAQSLKGENTAERSN
ncbi:hypothetical protein KAF25_006742 [Fusarium avenaceum]|uniref:BTB domain-containing protein n=1 Tax=Fusarium avenaceum TaxID=40199 RepID=A0A9P7H749_9HYPO|nr:hypothetical protein KAF25_006742 [Fusarium avenaceum]